MKPIRGLLVFLFWIGLLFHLSCKKEYSCEGCNVNKPPIANAGPDQVIALPTDSVSLDGSSSSDPDGTIGSFQWTKITGPASFTIYDPSGTITVVKDLIAGVYQFELKVTDNGGFSAKDTLRVTVDVVITTNHPPIADAGADQVITLPVNTSNLDGSGSTDPDNNITSYQWTKFSGPSTFTIATPNTIQTQVTALLQGIYQFELKVTDAGGLSAKDTVRIIVQATGPPPQNCDTANRPVSTASFPFSGQLPEARYGITVATAGNKILIAGGFRSYTGDNPADFSSRVDIYDITTGQWAITQLSESRVIGAVAVLGNKIFFGGGYGNTPGTTVDIYDVSTNTWSITQLSQARGGIAGGAIGNKVFFVGGTIWVPVGGGYYNQQLVDRVDIYDATTNSLSTASLSEGRYCINDLEKITVTVVGNKIFFSGGSCNILQDCSTNRIDIYDAVTNTWSNENYMAQNGGSLFSGVAAGNKNYRVTGEYWAGGNIVEIRDEVTQATTYDCLSGTLSKPPVRNGNKLIFPVSRIPQYTLNYRLTHFDIYDLSTNTWSISNLPQIVHLSWFITVNNEVYAVGGSPTTPGFIFDKLYKLAF